uniref:Spatacsin C-terminal domain-containing protein n=1 Tax=Anopheles triannulatus TaxID=58253 RepID=A0A2M4A770_9DIPT
MAPGGDVPVPPEKSIVLKGWEKLEDDVIIKEVATKGKHVNLCIQFLAERNELSAREAKNYFLQKVNAYVYRLLSNRQLFKAHHILKNIDRVPKYVFYQIATETPDHGLREYIQDHLARTVEQYEQGEKERIAANWRVYTQLKANVRQMADVLNEVASGYSVLEIETMSFNTFCMKEDLYRNTVAVDLFFKNQETEISPILDRYSVWSYLLKNNIANLVKIWIQLNSCLRDCLSEGRDPTPHILRIKIDIYDDPRFNERLRQLFQRWEIDEFMLSQLSHHRTLARNEILLNELARLGKFLDHERSNAVAIMRRLFTTESFARNRELAEERWFREQITRQFVENRFFTLLDLPIVSRELLEKLAQDTATTEGGQVVHRAEVNLFLELQKLKKQTPIGEAELLAVSRTCSQYILQHNRSFYEENPIVYLFEHGLDASNDRFPAADDPILSKLPHLSNFVRRYNNASTATELTKETSRVLMGKLLAIAGIPDPSTIQSHLFSQSCEDEDERALRSGLLQQHGTIPHFNHPLLIEKYGQPVRLRYLHYIRLGRACYAVHEFYREQLKHYSQISVRQINGAAQAVAQLAIERYWDQEVVPHAIAFMEMVGVSTVPTRAYLRCLALVHGECDRSVQQQHQLSVAELLSRCETAIASKSLKDCDLLVDLEAMTVVAKVNGLPYPEQYLREQLLAVNDWYRFLLLVDYLGYPQQQIIELCRTGFRDEQIGVNLMTALLHQPKAVVAEDGRSVEVATIPRRRSSLTPRRRRRGSSTTAESSGHSSVSSESDAISSRSATGALVSSSSVPTSTLAASVSTSTDTTAPPAYEAARFLSERYDTDLVSMVLLCSNEANPYSALATPTLSKVTHPFDYGTFKQLTLAASGQPANHQAIPRYPHTYQNLLDRAIRRRWPLLALLAGDVCPPDSDGRRYCWMVWVMLAGDYPFRERLASGPEESAFVCGLLEHLVRTDRICTLASSLAVFYPGSNWHHLAAYLSFTRDVLFDVDRATQLLINFLATSTGDECFLLRQPKYEMFNFCARLLTLHLCNRSSVHHQQLLLESYVRSDIRCFLTAGLDFERMLRVCAIVRHCDVAGEVLRFLERSCNAATGGDTTELYETLCEQLVARKCHEAAIAVADEAGLPKESIIFEHWVSYFEANGTVGKFDRYRIDSERYGLRPELRINFFIHIANRLEYGDPARYQLLKRALELIREFGLYPSESFDRDRVEYELALSYVRCSDAAAQEFELYCSHYWTTACQRQPREGAAPVLYHTFLELKEVAGIDDLTLANVPLTVPEEKRRLDALINRLLDCGDIVQALRYQAIFEQRPVDLHFVVFCMALAEGLISLYNLSKEERMVLNEDSVRSSGRFQRRTLRISRVSQSSAVGRYDSSPMKNSGGGTGGGQLDTSDASTTAASDFEEVPSRERQDVFEAISGLGNRITHGQDLARRVILTYRAAMYLDREYNELLKLRDPLAFLPEIVHEDCVHKLEVISDIVTATGLSVESFTDFLASEIVSAVVRSKFYLFQQQQQQSATAANEELLWGYNIDREFHLFLELAPNTTALGNALLRYCEALRLYRKRERQEGGSASANVQDALESLETPLVPTEASGTGGNDSTLLERLDAILPQQVLSLKKQNTIIVALLVKAHDCFVHECSMEGIMEVLACCKQLTQALTAAKSWNLIVRLLVGIGRYRDMCYCFETLIKNEQFESLLGQFDDRAASGRRLQTAIIAYLNEHCPERKDYFRLAALHFRMYKEIAELWEAEARATIEAIVASYGQRRLVSRKETVCQQRLQTTPMLLTELTSAMDAYTHATDNYLLDNNLTLAQRAASNAELLALQIFFVRQSLGTDKGGSGASVSSSVSSTNPSPSRVSSAGGSSTGSPASQEPCNTCLSVLNIRSNDEGTSGGGVASSGALLYYINFLLTVPQALIVGRAYGVEINWPSAIYQHYVIDGQRGYLEDYLNRLPLTDAIIETLVKMFQLEPHITPAMEQAIGTFIDRIQSVTLKYRLASLLGLKQTIHALINGTAVYYLKDTNYGKNDVDPCGGGGGGAGAGTSGSASGSSAGTGSGTPGGSMAGSAIGAGVMSSSIRSISSSTNTTTTSTATSA